MPKKIRLEIDVDIAFVVLSAELGDSKCAVGFQAGWKGPRQSGGGSTLPAPDIYDLSLDQGEEVPNDPQQDDESD